MVASFVIIIISSSSIIVVVLVAEAVTVQSVERLDYEPENRGGRLFSLLHTVIPALAVTELPIQRVLARALGSHMLDRT
jgi:hypothetical protein